MSVGVFVWIRGVTGGLLCDCVGIPLLVLTLGTAIYIHPAGGELAVSILWDVWRAVCAHICDVCGNCSLVSLLLCLLSLLLLLFTFI